MTRALYTDAVDALVQASSVCIITHLRPDADAIGSAAALALGLRQRGKQTRTVIGQRREVSRNLLSIPTAEDIELVESLPSGYDLYVTVDCGSLDRTGLLAGELAVVVDSGRVLCIDHHASNPGFGSINLVDPACESTTVVLLDVLDRMAVQIDRTIAHCLYAGLVTDTGSFRWGRPRMHDIAARLMMYDLDTKQIAVDLMDSSTADDLQMVGRVLAGLRIEEAGQQRLGILVVPLEEVRSHSDAAVESLVDFVRALEGTTMGVVFKEQAEGVWAVSLRSSVVNCAEVALGFGGGGHVPAAGYTAKGSPEQIISQLVGAVA
ncbi:bifunctional oligoribonuclease/PAP phosphatase NrnA [Corynebacterium sp.]|uniref:DHH family phosphoesterase n=1 Tax=Corynebacterium sp. TaxID=1720 RepID=UPI0026DA89ED|nr:bifunctional oligoribonuclease/PAP phosphatase NrnA [Corynebacterium sp.]MDO5032465.1 bifunctional oligoribonuclease/PAP phosphatase NrnA [Corynebacterium sp.]